MVRRYVSEAGGAKEEERMKKRTRKGEIGAD
jgi:hypothetical protein